MESKFDNILRREKKNFNQIQDVKANLMEYETLITSQIDSKGNPKKMRGRPKKIVNESDKEDNQEESI